MVRGGEGEFNPVRYYSLASVLIEVYVPGEGQTVHHLSWHLPKENE